MGGWIEWRGTGRELDSFHTGGEKKQNAWTPCATEEWAERLFLEVRCVYGGSKALLAAPWGWNCHLQREK